MKHLFVRFVNNESAATAIAAIIAVVNGLGSSLNAKFSTISTQLK